MGKYINLIAAAILSIGLFSSCDSEEENLWVYDVVPGDMLFDIVDENGLSYFDSRCTDSVLMAGVSAEYNGGKYDFYYSHSDSTSEWSNSTVASRAILASFYGLYLSEYHYQNSTKWNYESETFEQLPEGKEYKYLRFGEINRGSDYDITVTLRFPRREAPVVIRWVYSVKYSGGNVKQAEEMYVDGKKHSPVASPIRIVIPSDK